MEQSVKTKKSRRTKIEVAEPLPEESPAIVAAETPVIAAVETPVQTVKETQKPKNICGINGCTTQYDNPIIMKRHRERVHGIGGAPNINVPAPRNPEIKNV